MNELNESLNKVGESQSKLKTNTEKQEILARKAMADVTKNMRAVVKDYFNISKLKK